MGIDLSGYVEVKDRIAAFKEAFPDGRLQSEVIPAPDGFVAVKAYAYRTPDDPTPGVGLAWEPFPGKTPYTKDSELQNAETSAWGRALIAALVADASTGVASANEVRNRASAQPDGGTGGSTGETSSYSCPSCGSPVQNNLPEHFGDGKKPAWRCSNRDCGGGSPKKSGGGNWPWATWDADHFKEDEFPDPTSDVQPEREDFPPVDFETGELLEYDPNDAERPF